MNNPLSHHNPLPFASHPGTLEPVDQRAVCTRVIDGDTYDMILECRPTHILTTERVRLADVDTPEIYGSRATPEGKVAKARVEELILGRDLLARHNDKRDKYGRLIVEVYYQTEGRWQALGETLLTEGLGVFVQY